MATPFTLAEARFEKKAADQTVTTPEIEVTFNNPDVGSGYFCPGADGVKDFFVFYTLSVDRIATAGAFPFRVRLGATGTVADAPLWEGGIMSTVTGTDTSRLLAVKIPAPGAADVVTLTHATDGVGQIVRGGATLYSSLLIWRA